MNIEIVENIDSVLPLFHLSRSGVTSIPNEQKAQVVFVQIPDKSIVIDSALEPKGFREGGVQEIIVEMQKRDSRLRAQAIELYGYNCYVCGLNFEKVYGELGAGYIEVHHLIPLSNAKEERVTTIEDVCIVCANCHRVLHHNGKEPIPVDELRKIVAERRSLEKVKNA
jgi:5-methylcytosine-specific restriction protein A